MLSCCFYREEAFSWQTFKNKPYLFSILLTILSWTLTFKLVFLFGFGFCSLIHAQSRLGENLLGSPLHCGFVLTHSWVLYTKGCFYSYWSSINWKNSLIPGQTQVKLWFWFKEILFGDLLWNALSCTRNNIQSIACSPLPCNKMANIDKLTFQLVLSYCLSSLSCAVFKDANKRETCHSLLLMCLVETSAETNHLPNMFHILYLECLVKEKITEIFLIFSSFTLKF